MNAPLSDSDFHADAPVPVLGSAPALAAGTPQERRVAVRSRVAMGFSAASVVLLIVMITFAIMLPDRLSANRHTLATILGLISVFCFVCTLLGIGIGIASAKTRLGKTALATALFPVVIVAFLVALSHLPVAPHRPVHHHR